MKDIDTNTHAAESSYICPYPDCKWTPSRPTDPNNGLTLFILNKEIRDHRKTHAESRESALNPRQKQSQLGDFD